MTAASPIGRLYGIGLGPGDPELLTVKAVRHLQAAPVVAYFAKAGRRGNARGIADQYISASSEELPLYYPVTTELPFAEPAYNAALSGFYEEAAESLAAHDAATNARDRAHHHRAHTIWRRLIGTIAVDEERAATAPLGKIKPLKPAAAAPSWGSRS